MKIVSTEPSKSVSGTHTPTPTKQDKDHCERDEIDRGKVVLRQLKIISTFCEIVYCRVEVNESCWVSVGERV